MVSRGRVLVGDLETRRAAQATAAGQLPVHTPLGCKRDSPISRACCEGTQLEFNNTNSHLIYARHQPVLSDHPHHPLHVPQHSEPEMRALLLSSQGYT